MSELESEPCQISIKNTFINVNTGGTKDPRLTCSDLVPSSSCEYEMDNLVVSKPQDAMMVKRQVTQTTVCGSTVSGSAFSRENDSCATSCLDYETCAGSPRMTILDETLNAQVQMSMPATPQAWPSLRPDSLHSPPKTISRVPKKDFKKVNSSSVFQPTLELPLANTRTKNGTASEVRQFYPQDQSLQSMLQLPPEPSHSRVHSLHEIPTPPMVYPTLSPPSVPPPSLPAPARTSNDHVEAFERSLGINGRNTNSGSRNTPEGTTLMLKNIPNRYTQLMLIDLLDNKLGFFGTYDFLYLPIDFRNRCNMGYAFVNFVDSTIAAHFRQSMNHRKLPSCHSNKVCEVAYARVQGLRANIEHYRNSPINGVPIPSYRPKLFKNGVEYPFPAPDAPLPQIQLRAPRVMQPDQQQHQSSMDMYMMDDSL